MPMTDNEVLSALNKMDEEHRNYMSQFGARQFVREVITKFVEAKKWLAESNVEAKIESAKAQIASLEGQYAVGVEKINKDLDEKRAAAQDILDNINKLITAAQTSHQEISKRLANYEIEVSAKIVELDAKIDMKEKDLLKVTVAFDDFKKSHNL